MLPPSFHSAYDVHIYKSSHPEGDYGADNGPWTIGEHQGEGPILLFILLKGWNEYYQSSDYQKDKGYDSCKGDNLYAFLLSPHFNDDIGDKEHYPADGLASI